MSRTDRPVLIIRGISLLVQVPVSVSRCKFIRSDRLSWSFRLLSSCCGFHRCFLNRVCHWNFHKRVYFFYTPAGYLKVGKLYIRLDNRGWAFKRAHSFESCSTQDRVRQSRLSGYLQTRGGSPNFFNIRVLRLGVIFISLFFLLVAA